MPSGKWDIGNHEPYHRLLPVLHDRLVQQSLGIRVHRGPSSPRRLLDAHLPLSARGSGPVHRQRPMVHHRPGVGGILRNLVRDQSEEPESELL